MIKGFLFDLDGVIVDTAVFHFQAWRPYCAKSWAVILLKHKTNNSKE
jgi:beta-phosphoglucomutase